MFSHVTVGTNDLVKAAAFYRSVMPFAGLPDFHDFSEHGMIGFSKAGLEQSEFFVCLPFDGKPATVGNGVTVAFLATNRKTVDEFYAAAIAAGGKDEGPPGLRPQYDPDYYATYVRDLDGHKLCCVCRDSI